MILVFRNVMTKKIGSNLSETRVAHNRNSEEGESFRETE